MVYIFVFLGEFGYELLNWQGVLRKFSRTLSRDDSIVCCSRARVYPIYEFADLYVDISDVALYRCSRACCYSGTIGVGSPARRVNRAFDACLRAAVRSSVRRQLKSLRPGWTDRRVVFVFSSRRTEVRGVIFGCDPDRVERDADIDERLNVEANVYVRLQPDPAVRRTIEERVGFDLEEPYILVQTRSRRVGPQWGQLPSTDAFIDALAKRSKVVLLSFRTGRALDSYSHFEEPWACSHYAGRSFPEQALLIHFARHCIFLTEGDFGSHLYVPPFMGKDVIAIVPGGLCGMWLPGIAHWNQHVFRFGGQIVPRIAESVLINRHEIEAFADGIGGALGAPK